MPATSGAGFKLLHPAAPTRAWIIANDRPFAEEVAGHNRFCRTQKACAGERKP
jgi:hypothetical protein